ncbi:MAG: ATP-dependent DNA helicase RecG [Planctomycetes bacterium]|nr:ATP-dependent DNA helicase RecG [Planctomycetota bacterium]
MGATRNRVAPSAGDQAHELPLTVLAGVGPARAARLAALGLETVRDLLCVLPRRVERWRERESIASARAAQHGDGAEHRVHGSIVRLRFSRFGRRSLLRLELADGSAAIDVLFFNQPWLRERFRKDQELEVTGRIVDAQGVALVATRVGSASAPLPQAGTLEPIYPSTSGLSSEMLRALCVRALEEHGERLRETLDQRELARRGLISIERAVRQLHRPASEAEFAAARRRMALEPLLELQANLLARRRAREATGAWRAVVDDARDRALIGSFPFEWTAGQRRAAAEIRADLARGAPMRRLLQGDVGSGKTVLGAYACMLVASSGAQAAFLAPTEVLAEQHLRVLGPWLERAQRRTALLTGALGARERRLALERLARGELDVVFGTHALLGSQVRFARLALAVVDEQHRFGVAQRERLFDKGLEVHGLLMTATPIPRSLALSIYGDLDVSLLREKPSGRGTVVTRRVAAARDVIPDVEARLERGERVYWVVPRIDGDEDDELGAEQRFERLRGKRWARFGVELVHGRIDSQERDARLARFRDGAARILVATTVIEVGVDVPEATVMVVEHAQRLGLAQLHQLRGRVGRGAADSVCYLIGAQTGSERLALLERTLDGFEIAEADLAQRGMGDLVGLRQAGENREGLASDELDLELLCAARELVASDPALARRHASPRRLS